MKLFNWNKKKPKKHLLDFAAAEGGNSLMYNDEAFNFN